MNTRILEIFFCDLNILLYISLNMRYERVRGIMRFHNITKNIISISFEILSSENNHKQLELILHYLLIFVFVAYCSLFAPFGVILSAFTSTHDKVSSTPIKPTPFISCWKIASCMPSAINCHYISVVSGDWGLITIKGCYYSQAKIYFFLS